MKENKKISMLTLLFALATIFLLMLIIGLVYYYQKEQENEDKTITNLTEQVAELKALVDNTKKQDTNTENKDKLNKSKKIELSDVEKVSINAGLNYSKGLIYGIRRILNDEISNIEYDTNLLEKEVNKYNIVWETMSGEDIKYKKGDATGEVSIPVEVLNTYYNKILGSDLNTQALLAIEKDIPYNIGINNEMFYGTIITAWGEQSMALKAKELVLDETTKTYTLTTDFLYTENGSIEEEANDFAGKYDTLKYADSLIKTELEIKYQEKENGNKILVSLMFKK